MYVACTELRVIQTSIHYDTGVSQDFCEKMATIWSRWSGDVISRLKQPISAGQKIVLFPHPGTTCALSTNLVRLTCDQSERFCDRKSPNSTTIDIAPLLEIQAPIHNSSLYRIENDWPPSWINWSWVCPQWLMGCGIKIFSRPSENDVTESPE